MSTIGGTKFASVKDVRGHAAYKILAVGKPGIGGL